MKESRIIIIVLIIMILLIDPVCDLLDIYLMDSSDSMAIATNMYCGGIVGLVTAICQYYICKRKIVSTVYGVYFDLYKTYYYSKNKSVLWHYNVRSLYKKMMDLSPKIIDALDEYHGFFRKKDKCYRKMNPIIQLGDSYKAKNVIKTLFWFNQKAFDQTIQPYINEVEKILNNINKKRFEKDKEQMIKMFNYIWK